MSLFLLRATATIVLFIVLFLFTWDIAFLSSSIYLDCMYAAYASISFLVFSRKNKRWNVPFFFLFFFRSLFLPWNRLTLVYASIFNKLILLFVYVCIDSIVHNMLFLFDHFIFYTFYSLNKNEFVHIIYNNWMFVIATDLTLRFFIYFKRMGSFILSLFLYN